MEANSTVGETPLILTAMGPRCRRTRHLIGRRRQPWRPLTGPMSHSTAAAAAAVAPATTIAPYFSAFVVSVLPPHGRCRHQPAFVESKRP